MKVSVQFVKAFTSNKNEGNPAGVVHDADWLTEEQMLGIARELGFSESAFIQRSSEADFKVRFFAAKQEVDFRRTSDGSDLPFVETNGGVSDR